MASDTDLHTIDTRTFPVIEEVASFQTVAIDQGGYRLTKRVAVRDVSVDPPLASERVDIERRPIGRALAEGEMPATRQEGDVLVVPVLEEVLITVKRLMLVEEIRITRSRQTHRKPQTVTLRTEEIEVERLDAEPRSDAASVRPPTPQG